MIPRQSQDIFVFGPLHSKFRNMTALVTQIAEQLRRSGRHSLV
jgi:hypothetical protein